MLAAAVRGQRPRPARADQDREARVERGAAAERLAAEERLRLLRQHAAGRRDRSQLERLQRSVPAEVEVALGLRELEAVPLEQHREVGRLLELDEQDAGADRVRRPGGDEDRVAGARRGARAGRRASRPSPASRIQRAHLGELDVALEAGPAPRRPARRRRSATPPSCRRGCRAPRGRTRGPGWTWTGSRWPASSSLTSSAGVGAVAADVLGARGSASGSAAIASRTSVPSSSRLRPRSACAERGVDGAQPFLGHVVGLELEPAQARRAGRRRA